MVNMTPDVFIGIDPGKGGGVAIILEGRLLIYPTPLVYKEYDIPEMASLLKTYASEKTFTVLERAQSMPKQGVKSSFEFGKGYGLWLGLLTALNIPFQVVHSSTWTRSLLKGAPGKGKQRSALFAKQLFPEWKPEKKKELEFADAILLAEYAKRLKHG